jgi:SSS family solute:Na+ symporter
VVFIYGVFWRKASSKGALVTLIAGSVLGLTVFLLDWFKDGTGWNVPFMLSAFYLFLACSAILITISLLSPHKHTPESEKLVWKNPMDALRGEAWRGIGNYKFIAGLLFVVMIVLYIVFA